ncbi:MAG: hypothetical protein ACYS8I_07080 [Planctomycetota bacterium]
MGLRSRKTLIGLVSLGAVLTVYLVYTSVSKTPEIDLDKGAGFTNVFTDANTGDPGGKKGTIGPIDVDKPIMNAEYHVRNRKTKRLERVFGFEKAFHRYGQEWEAEKPYMNVYQRTFNCYITADKGYVQIESATATSQPTPQDATLIGNVVIHILPAESGSIKESHVYLDDVDFISERSLFRTAGPVTFKNEDAVMLGRGLEIVYREAAERLEYLRLIHLETISCKTAPESPASSKEAADPGPTKPPSRVRPTERKPAPEQKEGEYYKCLFSKNVLVETPGELILTNLFSINDIFWPKSSTDANETTDTNAPDSATTPPDTGAEKTEPDEPSQVPLEFVITCDNGLVLVPADSNKALDYLGVSDDEKFDVTAAHKSLTEEPNGRSILIAEKIDYSASTGNALARGPVQLTFYPNDVTASDADANASPVRVTAQEKATFLAASNQAIFEGDCFCTAPQAESGTQDDYTLSAPKLIVNLPEEGAEQPPDSADVVAVGPVELQFYVDMNDMDQSGSKTVPVPATLTAQKQASFCSTSNQAVFEGKSLCIMVREDPNFRQQYRLSAPRLTIDLPKARAKEASSSAASIEHLTADGGPVSLSTTKRALAETNLPKTPKDKAKLLNGIELKCTRFDYDTARQVSTATGPGVLAFYNSDVPTARTDSKSKGFGFDRPCWAFMHDFHTLKYLLEPNLIIADAEDDDMLLIRHFPLVDGQPQYDQEATILAGHIEARLTESPDGQNELSTLHATRGITYEDKDKQFVGTELFYDHSKSTITVLGDDVQPCILNGTLVDAIEYNVLTGRVKTKITAPGALQRKR